MQANTNSLWGSRLITFILAALAAASAVYWSLKGTSADSTANTVATASTPALDPQAVARALGGGQVKTAASPSPAPARNIYVLAGVIASHQQGGAALISIAGKPAKPFRVGALVDAGLILQSVAARRAVLATDSNAPAQITLELPPLGSVK